MSSAVLFGLWGIPAAAQLANRVIDRNEHVWASYSGDHDVKGKWGVHFDAQWRRSDFGTEWQQYQLRPALNYRVNSDLLLTTGYVFTRAYPYGDFPVRAAFPEHRFYQQALWRQRLKKITFVQRYRLEERLIQYPQTVDRSYTYQNRFRYQLKAEVPLVRDTDGARRLYFAAFNEILLGIPPNYGPRVYDQNRTFVGLGQPMGNFGNVEVGYMVQHLSQRNGRIFELNHTVFMTITSNYSLANLWRKKP